MFNLKQTLVFELELYEARQIPGQENISELSFYRHPVPRAKGILTPHLTTECAHLTKTPHSTPSPV